MNAVSKYLHHDDERIALVNRIAFIVALNQPFYPLYVYWFVTGRFEPALLTLLSTPFFLMVPLASRLSATAGLILVVLAGTGNTLMCAKLFGPASGVELFLIPCALLPALTYRTGERAVAFGLVGLIVLLFGLSRTITTVPSYAYSTSELSSFCEMHAYSVFCLTVLIGFSFGRLRTTA